MDINNLYLSEDGCSYAVLVSSGWGAGWSTWNEKELAYDKRVVQWFLDYKAGYLDLEDIKYNLNKIGYDPYTGGWSDIHIEWVTFGVGWYINEYDGYETLIRVDEDDRWTTFYNE